MEAAENLQRWEDAFENHPIATTRAVERQLRASIANEKGKLRNLVGSNYQDLLASADQISQLQIRSKLAETQLSDIGQQCQSLPLSHTTRRVTQKRAAVTQLRLLQRCLSEATTDLRQSRLLRCAQLITMGRILAKSVADTRVLALEALQQKLKSTRRKLLSAIDLNLVRSLSDSPELLNACCSYSLVTSASSDDVLHHVQDLRLKRITTLLAVGSRDQGHLLEAIQYFSDSVAVFKQFTGRALADSLGQLQKRPILDDPALREIEVLDLSNVLAFLPDDIRTFLPYFKRIIMTAGEAQQRLTSWAEQVSLVVSASLESSLLSVESFTTLLDFRNSMLKLLLGIYFSTPGARGLYDTIRSAFEDRIGAISTHHADGLLDFVDRLMASRIDSAVVLSMWDQSLIQASLKNGGQNHVHQLQQKRLGRPKPLVRAFKSIEAWISTYQDNEHAIVSLRQIRWRDSLEEPDEDQETEAEDLIKDLTHQTPDLYEVLLHKSLGRALSTYELTTVEAACGIIDQSQGGTAAAALLRSIRDTLGPLNNAFQRGYQFDEIRTVIPKLHDTVAAEIVNRLVAMTEKPAHVPQSSQHLEGLPSPRTFGFARTLALIMTDVGGTDIWSPSAVHTVKTAVARHVFDEKQRQHYIENEFDDGYLRMMLQLTIPEISSPSDRQRKSAEEYWTRTKVLFGVLAQ